MTSFHHDLADECASLAAAWRVLGRLGLVDTIFNHISSAVETGDSTSVLIINPSTCLAEELSPQKVCICPLREYSQSEAAELGVNPDGLRLHSLMHNVRKRSGTIVHTHSLYAVAVGCSEHGLLPLSQTAMEFVDNVHTIDYEGVFRLQGLPPKLSHLAREGGVGLLRNHGSIVVADTVAEAVYLTFYLEEACRIQVAALSQRAEIRSPPDSLVFATARELRADRPSAAAQLFAALRRRLPSTP